jgi:photosystem II stability/assembly factor-like uncharacterized protein
MKYDVQVFDATWKQLAWITSEENDAYKLRPSTEWQSFSRQISMPASAARAIFYLNIKGDDGAKVWLDNLRIVEPPKADFNPNASAQIGASAPIRVLGLQPYKWRSLPTGGVEYATGLVWNPRHPQDLYLRADGGGIWKFDRKNTRWIALMDNLPWKWSNLTTVESIGVDANNRNVLYVAAGSSRWNKPHDVLKTTDGGKTWQRTFVKNEKGEDVMSEGNGPNKQGGERLVVDPNSPNVLFFGSRNDGLFTSRNGAKTWQQVQSFPTKGARWGGITFVTLDWKAGKGGQPTQTMYVGVHAGRAADGNDAPLVEGGVYRSTDGGKTWARSEGGPTKDTSPLRGRIGPDGTLFVTTVSNSSWDSGGNGKVWKFKNEKWSDITPEPKWNYCGINIHPTDANKIVCSPTGGKGNVPWFYSTDGGATWKKYQTAKDNKSGNAVRLNTPAYEAHGEENWPGNTADIAFDPLDPRAVWETDFGGPNRTFDMGQPALKWTLIGEGREQMTTAEGVGPSKGAPYISGIWDLGGFRYEEAGLNKVPDERFAVRQPDGTPHTGYDGYMNHFQDTFDMDVSPLNPDAIVAAGGWQWNNTGTAAISTDNGRIFRRVESKPFPEARFGRVAISATDGRNFLWAPMGDDKTPVYFTRDGGATWDVCQGAPLGMINTQGPWTFFKLLAADRMQPATFYIYDRRDGRFYRSQDGGATWKHLSTLPTQPGNHYDNHRLEAAPNSAKQAWLALHDKGLFRTGNGGQNWTKISGVDWAVNVSFGKAAPGRTNPTVFLLGQLSGKSTSSEQEAEVNLYRSDDMGTTWMRVNDAERGMGGVGNITGDMQNYGRVYIGTGGRGTFYGQIASASTRTANNSH